MSVKISGTRAETDHIFSGNIPSNIQDYYEKCREKEPQITSSLMDAVSQTGGRLEGLEYSVKTASSIENKILRKEEKLNDSFSQAGIKRNVDKIDIIKSFSDIIRYTEILPKDLMASSVSELRASLEDKGFIVTKIDNFFAEPKEDTHYKGHHLDLVSPSGAKIEFQIHTQESFDTKMDNHDDYDIVRDPTGKYTEEEKNEAKWRMIEQNDKISDVPNIEKIESLEMEKDKIETLVEKLDLEYDEKMEKSEDDPYREIENESDDIDSDDDPYMEIDDDDSDYIENEDNNVIYDDMENNYDDLEEYDRDDDYKNSIESDYDDLEEYEMDYLDTG